MGFADVQLQPGPSTIRPSVLVTCGGESTVTVGILDAEGHPFDLTDFISTDSLDNSPGGPCPTRILPIKKGILFTLRTHRGQIPPQIQRTIEVEGDAKDGLVTVPFYPCDFTHPGLFLAEIDLVDENKIKYVYNLYVEAAPTLAWSSNDDPISIEEIRLWARDNSPEDNFLLDEVEFKDTEIIAAIRRVVDMWNATPPLMPRYEFNTTNFPYRSQWIDATIGFLMGIAGLNYLRNMLAYQAGGISIDDKKLKAQAYQQEADKRKAEFKEWMMQIKPQLNAYQAFGRVGFAPRSGIGR